MDEDFVVFLIGMRINKFWRVWDWLPAFIVMPRMLRELEVDPDSGLLGYRMIPGLRNFAVVQYWRSAKELQEYAFDRDRLHFPAWGRFNRTSGDSGAVGIWHETYLISANKYETVYNNMPPFGLGTVGECVPARGSQFHHLTAEDETDVSLVPPSEEYE